MATEIHPSAFVDLLCCPCPAKAPIVCRGGDAICTACGKIYPIREGILDLVDESALDAETARELKGNTLPLTEENIRFMSNRDASSSYHAHIAGKRLDRLARFIRRTGCRRVISLGSGAGIEIKAIARELQLEAVFCSDLSFSNLCIAPTTLAQTDVTIGRFTSNLDECPVAAKDIPIVIYEALHHTKDMHAAIGRMLDEGYEHILFAEPTSNVIMRALARFGLAQRVEYSGVKPDRLDIRRLKALCRARGYAAAVTTRWIFPEDYFRKLFGTSMLAERCFLKFLDLVSAATGPFSFGNASVVHLKRLPSADPSHGQERSEKMA